MYYRALLQGNLPNPEIEPTSLISPALSSGWASPVAQLVKNPPAMQETPVGFLVWEDPLEKGQATHSSIPWLPWWLRR